MRYRYGSALYEIHARHAADEAARDKAALEQMPAIFGECAERCGRAASSFSAYCSRCRTLHGFDDESDRFNGGDVGEECY